jgi:hypothetical protein
LSFPMLTGRVSTHAPGRACLFPILSRFIGAAGDSRPNFVRFQQAGIAVKDCISFQMFALSCG